MSHLVRRFEEREIAPESATGEWILKRKGNTPPVCTLGAHTGLVSLLRSQLQDDTSERPALNTSDFRLPLGWT